MRRNLPRLVTFVASVIALLLLLLFFAHQTAFATVVQGSGAWVDVSAYCGSGVCVPVAANHNSQASLDRYQSSYSIWITYWQNFGGSVTRGSGLLCGSHDFIKMTTKYKANGTTIIGGWVAQSTICSTNVVCRAWRSENDYWIYGTAPRGRFGSATSFGVRCVPSLGVEHIVAVPF